MEDLEQRCYAELVECCKEMAKAANVANYVTIMNLQVRFYSFLIIFSSSNVLYFLQGLESHVEANARI